MTERYSPPADFLPQLLPVVAGVVISSMAIIELTDHLNSHPVRYNLLPLCVLALTQTVVTLVSLLHWFPYHDFPLLKKTLIANVFVRLLYSWLDTYIYIQRTRSIMTFYPKWQIAIFVFLALRCTWLTILNAFDLRKLIPTQSAAQLFGTIYATWTTALNITQLVSPVAQALIVDDSLLYVIVATLRTAGRDVRPSWKRLTRIVLLIVISCVFFLVHLTSPHSMAATALVAGITGNVVIALSAFVNIDLYLLDIALFSSKRAVGR